MLIDATDSTALLTADHEVIERVLDAFQRTLAAPTPPPPAVVQDVLDYCELYVAGCHSRKEEDCLFPQLEVRGVPRTHGPLAALLLEHEQSIAELRLFARAATAYIAGRADVLPMLANAFSGYAGILRDHFWKENDVLFPAARRVLSGDDHRRVIEGIAAIESSRGTDTRQSYYGLAERIIAACELADLSASLDPDVLAAMLNALPIELSFVDADDRVRYFSHEHRDKIFPRTRAAIGRAVQQCHPPRSVDRVNAILDSFKQNRRDMAEFWLDSRGRKIHVKYLAVRSREGKYLGCLETVQDITRLQQLRGERRLLDDEPDASR